VGKGAEGSDQREQMRRDGPGDLEAFVFGRVGVVVAW
jgi:hypothetical protein